MDMRLDFFLVTSSTRRVWGSRGQIVYAAANAFLDGLAWWLRARGVAATSVNFGLGRQAWARSDQEAVGAARSADDVGRRNAGGDGRAHHRIVAARGSWPGSTGHDSCNSSSSAETVGAGDMERELAETVAAPVPSATTPLVEELKASPVQQRKLLVLEYLRNSLRR